MDPNHLKKKLLEQYDGTDLEDLDGLEEVETCQGSVFNIKSEDKLKFYLKNQEKAVECLISDLKLVKGIGNSKENKLKLDGYNNLEDLQNHPRFGRAAGEVLSMIRSYDAQTIASILCERYSQSHPQMLNTCSFTDIEDFIFMDIETLGLKNQPIILLGEASISSDKITVNQYLLKDLNDEPAVLAAHLDSMNDNRVYVTFNGRSFDVPYIKDRLNYFQIDHKLDHHHLDLLHFSRRFYGNHLPNCQLTTIEEHLLGMERMEDVPGSLVPDFYKTYLETDNIGPLIPIIEHNRDDIISLARIISRMNEQID